MSQLVSRRLIRAKVESSYGVDPTLTDADDSIRVENPVFSWLDGRLYEPASSKPSLGAEPALFGGALGQLVFDVVLKGSGVAGTAPEADPLLRGAGLTPTVVASTSVTYAPVSTGQDSVALEFDDDGTMLQLLGGVAAEVSITGEVGQPVRASMTYIGHVTDAVDQALGSPTWDAVLAPVYLGASFSSHGFASKISNLSVALGLEVAKPGDVSGADGFGVLTQTGRKVTGTIDPLSTLVAAHDWVNLWKTQGQGSIVSGVIGGTAGNQLQITMPQSQYRELGSGDRESLASLSVGFTAVESSGDDELSIAFT